MADSFLLDGLQLNDLTTFGVEVDGFQYAPPKQRQIWLGAADSEAQVLFRNPLHENRTVTIPIAVMQQATQDLVFDKVGQVVDKLAKASRTESGISLAWTANGSSRTMTFTVLAGEIPDLPADWESGFLALSPTFTVVLTCAPYADGAEVSAGTASSSTPFVAMELASIPGDVPAKGRLVVTDSATQARRHVEWGLEGPRTYTSGTSPSSLMIDSDSLVTSGFSGTQTTTSGAYDPNATGNNSITLSLLAGTRSALCGTGSLLNWVGTFRVKARIKGGSALNLWRVSWQAGDGPWSQNSWASPLDLSGFQEIDLGTVTIPAATLGGQRMQLVIEIQAAATSPGTAALDYLLTIPQADGYGKARSQYNYTPGTVGGFDSFTSTTAGGTLNGRTAPLGGAWATSGDATDWAFDDLGTDGEGIGRQAAPSSSGRVGILGSTNYSDQSVQIDFTMADVAGTDLAIVGVFGRYTNSSNYIRGYVTKRLTGSVSGQSGNAGLSIIVVSGGVTVATAGTLAAGILLDASTTYTLRLLAYASGRVILALYRTSDSSLISSTEVSDVSVTSGGGLSNGLAGIYDAYSGSGTVYRHIDNFTASSPQPEAVTMYSGRSLQVRYDDTLRQNSGGYYGRPPSYNGSRFTVPPGTSRVMVKARRNDIETAVDDQVTDSTDIQVFYTPRYLVVPR